MAALLGLPSDRLKFTPHCRSSDHAFKSSETAAVTKSHLTFSIRSVKLDLETTLFGLREFVCSRFSFLSQRLCRLPSLSTKNRSAFRYV
jgi:hypothetical protein